MRLVLSKEDTINEVYCGYNNEKRFQDAPLQPKYIPDAIAKFIVCH